MFSFWPIVFVTNIWQEFVRPSGGHFQLQLFPTCLNTVALSTHCITKCIFVLIAAIVISFAVVVVVVLS